jgi:hypothetical protein
VRSASSRVVFHPPLGVNIHLIAWVRPFQLTDARPEHSPPSSAVCTNPRAPFARSARRKDSE